MNYSSSSQLVFNSSLSKKVDNEKLKHWIKESWDRGVNEYNSLQNMNRPIQDILMNEGIELIKIEKDELVGNMRYYCDFYIKNKKVKLYMTSIREWSIENNVGLNDAIEIILAHEYFHYLENTCLVPTSKLYKVPTLKIGKKTLLNSDFQALSEVSANAFANEFYNNRKKV